MFVSAFSASRKSGSFNAKHGDNGLGIGPNRFVRCGTASHQYRVRLVRPELGYRPLDEFGGLKEQSSKRLTWLLKPEASPRVFDLIQRLLKQPKRCSGTSWLPNTCQIDIVSVRFDAALCAFETSSIFIGKSSLVRVATPHGFEP